MSQYEAAQAIRREQMEVGRRLSDTNRKPLKRKNGPVGHENFLKALEASKARIMVVMTSGEQLEGRVKHSDKFTISLTPEDAVLADMPTRVIFKHAIEQFWPIDPPAFKAESQA